LYPETTPYPTEFVLIKEEWAFSPFPHHTGQIPGLGITGKKHFCRRFTLRNALTPEISACQSDRMGWDRQALTFENARLLLLLGCYPTINLHPQLSTMSFGTIFYPIIEWIRLLFGRRILSG
jgi:hypothetical protein